MVEVPRPPRGRLIPKDPVDCRSVPARPAARRTHALRVEAARDVADGEALGYQPADHPSQDVRALLVDREAARLGVIVAVAVGRRPACGLPLRCPFALPAHRPFNDLLPLELGDGPENLPLEPPGRRTVGRDGGVLERDAGLLELAFEEKGVGQIAGEAVGIVDEHDVDRSLPDRVSEPCERRPLKDAPRVTVVDVLSDHFPAPSGGEFGKRAALRVEPVLLGLIFGADAGVEGSPHRSASCACPASKSKSRTAFQRWPLGSGCSMRMIWKVGGLGLEGRFGGELPDWRQASSSTLGGGLPGPSRRARALTSGGCRQPP